MDKHLKYLMLLLVTTLSLTLTACGGDDDDEPTLPDSSFLYGTWHYQYTGYQDQCTDMTFSSDGSFNASIIQRRGGQFSVYIYIVRGKWEYKNGKINITSKAYCDDSLSGEYNSTLKITYDDYINKLIVEDTPYKLFDLSGQYTKM